MNDLRGPACWVCARRFKSSVPPGPANREDHHIFPQAAGGKDGPQVSLCSEHHSTLHKIASSLQAKQPYTKHLHGEPAAFHQKLLWLASKVVRAEAATVDDPNKLYRNGVMLNAHQTRMMQLLQKRTGKSRDELFKLGLALLYKHYNP